MYSFQEQLDFSRGVREVDDLETIEALLPGCTVRKTTKAQDVAGVDYIATLRNGAEIFIDGKARDRGASRFWRSGPEFALERWSVIPGGTFNTPRAQAKTGWTLCEKKQTDMVLFSFDPSDSHEVFLVSFQHLRLAFRANCLAWMASYKTDIQKTRQGAYQWESECVFVPAYVVLEAITDASRGTRPEKTTVPALAHAPAHIRS